MKKLLVLLGLLSISWGSAAAGVAYVDFDRVYRDSKVISAVRDDISVEFLDREDALKKVGEKIQTMQETLEKESLTLSEGEKDSRRRDIADLERDFVRDRRALAEDRGLRFQERRRVIDAEVGRIIEELAGDRGYDMVLNPYIILPFTGDRTLTHNIILYANEEADITEDVIELFDKQANVSQ